MVINEVQCVTQSLEDLPRAASVEMPLQPVCRCNPHVMGSVQRLSRHVVSCRVHLAGVTLSP
jgi:hypothetical protein